MPVLEDVGVHDERLAGAGRALEGDGAKVVRRVVRHQLGQRILAFCLVQIGAQAFGVGEVAVQVVLGEQQGEILVGLPRPAMLPGHAQTAAQRGDVGVVLEELLPRDLGAIAVPVQQQGRRVFALTAGATIGWQIAQPIEHVGHAPEIPEFVADEAMQSEAILEDGHFAAPVLSCPCGCMSTRQARKDVRAPVVIDCRPRTSAHGKSARWSRQSRFRPVAGSRSGCGRR